MGGVGGQSGLPFPPDWVWAEVTGQIGDKGNWKQGGDKQRKAGQEGKVRIPGGGGGGFGEESALEEKGLRRQRKRREDINEHDLSAMRHGVRPVDLFSTLFANNS